MRVGSEYQATVPELQPGKFTFFMSGLGFNVDRTV